MRSLKTKNFFKFDSYSFISNFSLLNVFNNIENWDSNITFFISYKFLNFFDFLNKNRLKNLFLRVVKDTRVWDEIIKMMNDNIMEISPDYFYYDKNSQFLSFLSFFLFQIYCSELDFYISNLVLRLNTRSFIKRKKSLSVNLLKTKFLCLIPIKYSKFSSLKLVDFKNPLFFDSSIEKDCFIFERNINYVRYMDCFLLGISGSKNFSLRINSKITSFLRGNLHLDMSYFNFSSGFESSTYFLGYQIQRAYFN